MTSILLTVQFVIDHFLWRDKKGRCEYGMIHFFLSSWQLWWGHLYKGFHRDNGLALLPSLPPFAWETGKVEKIHISPRRKERKSFSMLGWRQFPTHLQDFELHSSLLTLLHSLILSPRNGLDSQRGSWLLEIKGEALYTPRFLNNPTRISPSSENHNQPNRKLEKKFSLESTP